MRLKDGTECQTLCHASHSPRKGTRRMKRRRTTIATARPQRPFADAPAARQLASRCPPPPTDSLRQRWLPATHEPVREQFRTAKPSTLAPSVTRSRSAERSTHSDLIDLLFMAAPGNMTMSSTRNSPAHSRWRLEWSRTAPARPSAGNQSPADGPHGAARPEGCGGRRTASCAST